MNGADFDRTGNALTEAFLILRRAIDEGEMDEDLLIAADQIYRARARVFKALQRQ